MKFIYVMLLVALADFSKGQILQCYVCEGNDCINNSTIRREVCSGEEITTPNPEPTTVPSIGTQETTTTSAASGSTETTTSPATTTTPEATTSSTVQPETTTVNSTTTATTIAPDTTTSSATQPETTTAPETTTSSSIMETSSTTLASKTETVNVVSDTTTSKAEVTTATKTESATNAAIFSPVIITSNPIASEITKEATTTAKEDNHSVENTVQNSQTERFSSPSVILLNNYHHISQSRRDISNLTYSCYSAEFKENDQIKLKKGCVAVPTEKSACQVVAEKIGDRFVKDSCKACVKDLCNSSSILRLSILIIFAVIFVKLIM